MLFSPTTLAGLKLKNRFVMAPMTRSRAVENNAPNALVAEYYAQRSGAGMIVTEGTSPSPNGLGYARIPGLYSQAQIEGWKLVTKAVHEKGSTIFVQLMHTGRVGHEANLPAGAKVLAPSAVTCPGQMWTDAKGMLDHTPPQAMTEAEVLSTIAEYVQAAKNAIAAGFDGVELHAANGYLMEQFLHPVTNVRTDGWGGSAENRNRFVLEVAKQTAAAIGKEKVGIRVSPHGAFNGTGPFEGVDAQHVALASGLSALGLAYLHVVDHSSMGAPKVPDELKAALRAAFQGAYVLSGGYDRARAEADLAAKKGDLVAFGRAFLANPDLVERMQKDAPLAPPDMGSFYTPGPKGYTDYPTLG